MGLLGGAWLFLLAVGFTALEYYFKYSSMQRREVVVVGFAPHSLIVRFQKLKYVEIVKLWERALTRPAMSGGDILTKMIELTSYPEPTDHRCLSVKRWDQLSEYSTSRTTEGQVAPHGQKVMSGVFREFECTPINEATS